MFHHSVIEKIEDISQSRSAETTATLSLCDDLSWLTTAHI